MIVSLRPLTAAGAARIEGWFEHPEVRRRLGGPPWIHRELRLISERPSGVFRGKTVLRSYGWIAANDAGVPVAFIGGDVYDRWVRFWGDGRLSDPDPRRSMALDYVVDPARWRQGFGRATIR